MLVEWKKCDNKTEWDNWFISRGHAEFLQSYGWGEFQSAVGCGVERLQAVANGVVVFQAQIIKHKVGPIIRYAYLPRHAKASDEIISSLIHVLKDGKYSFIRFEPGFSEQEKIFGSVLTKNRQPGATIILDLGKTDEDLLAAMHPKTRYNIHLAEKKGVVVTKKKDIQTFMHLYKETSRRDKIKGHDEKYLSAMLKCPCVEQYTAYFGNEPVAANINIGFTDTYTYVHGASGGKFRNLMAPYLLQWVCIVAAKKLGYKIYDFWGVAPEVDVGGDAPISKFHNYSWAAGHPWTGVTRFKAGFGGTVKKYGVAVDVPIKKFEYRLYRLARKMRR